MKAVTSLLPDGYSEAYEKGHRFLQSRSVKDRSPSTSTAKSPPPLTSLPGLPAEIKQAIFSLLPDLESLKALILTCASLYHSFLDAESLILIKILQNEIDPSLMRDALAKLIPSQLFPRTKTVAENVVMLYATRGTSSPVPTLNLRNAAVLSGLRGHLHFFAKFDFPALGRDPVTGLSASPSELLRIMRKLYESEFYARLFAKCRYFPDDVSEGFAPRENEQLAYMRDDLTVVLFNCSCPLLLALADSG